MTDAMSAVRLTMILLTGAVALAIVLGGARPEGRAAGVLTTSDGDTVDVTGEARSGGLRFDAAVVPADRAWITAAIARARPEAARLIAEIDGLVTVGRFSDPGPTLGVTSSGPTGFRVDLDVESLDSENAGDRTTVVLHELGHVIDFALVPAAVNEALDAQVPRGGPCGQAVDCDREEERFADTFAKWALKGAVSEFGAGYGVAMPASIEDWGAPLSRLAFGLPGA